MAVRLARHARHQLRLARDRHRLPQSGQSFVTPRERPRERREKTCPLAEVVAHLSRWLNRFHLTYSFITFSCLFFVWLPFTEDSSFRRSHKSAQSAEHLLIPSNITETSLLKSSPVIFGFIDESTFQLVIRGGYIFVSALSVFPFTLLLYLPIIETISHRWLLSIFREMLFPFIFSPIGGQLVSGFLDRPLDMLRDFRLNSLLIVQMLGFLLCLFSSFVFGVIYASVQQSKPPLNSS